MSHEEFYLICWSLLHISICNITYINLSCIFLSTLSSKSANTELYCFIYSDFIKFTYKGSVSTKMNFKKKEKYCVECYSFINVTF